jgi:hypothetical protein
VTISLTNTSRRITTFVLPHESYCSARDRCACAIRRGGARVPGSLTLALDVRAHALEDVILRVPAIALAVRRGELRVEREDLAAPIPSHPQQQGGPEGAPTTHVEVPNGRVERIVEDRSR